MNTGKFLAALVVAFALGMVLGEVNRRRDQHPNWESRLVAGDEVEVHFPRELVDEPSTLAADGTPTKRPILARSRLFVYKTDSDTGTRFPPDGQGWWMMTLPSGQRIWLAEDLSKRTTE